MEKGKKVIVSRNLLEANRLIAERVREVWRERGTFIINLISAPGSGKTTLLERVAERMKNEKVVAITADIDTERDRRRIEKRGMLAYQIKTGGECHLEANIVEQALSNIKDSYPEYIFIENIGNLICPTEFDIGEHLRVLILSTTEGDDKVRKYPLAFRTSNLLLINKIDLLPYLNFDVKRVEKEARALNPSIRIMKISALTGEGVEDFVDYIRRERKKCMR